MLTAAKRELKVMFLTLKYNIMREMNNRGTFLLSVLLMILNDASFIIQWLILFSIKDSFGGYNMNNVLLLWGFSASVFGIASIFFHNAIFLSDMIVEGKLDALLVQPKNVLLSAITQKCEPSAFGDLIYGYIMLFISGISIKKFILFTLFSILGALSLTSYRVIVQSLSFKYGKIDLLQDSIMNLPIHFDTYPDTIFKGVVRILLFTIIPCGIGAYLPVHILNVINIKEVLYVIGMSIIFIVVAIIVFYRGLKRYSSSNLFSSRI